MTEQSELVLVLAADLEALCDVLGAHTHVVAVYGTGKPLQESIPQLGVSQAQAIEARLVAQQERRLAHALDAAGHRDLGLSRLYELGRDVDRLQAGGARPVDGDGRYLFGQPRSQGRQSRGVSGRLGLQHVAEQHLVDLVRFDVGPFEGRSDCGGAQVLPPRRL